MIVCPECGHENSGEAANCSNCGASLRVEQLETTMSLLIPGESIEEERVVDLDRLIGETPALVVVKGSGVGDTYRLDKEELAVGRDINSDIFLDDITVSRKHAVITHRGDQVTIADSGSLNGTYVNRNQIEDVILNDRDEVQVGKFKLVYLARREG